MAYAKVGPWVNAGVPPISAANLDQVETQYDEAKTDLDAHKIANIYHRWAVGKVLEGQGAGANPVEINKGSVLTVAETEVFSGNAPNPVAWTDLDLSGTIGANVALVLLKFYNANGGIVHVAFRPDGDADDSWSANDVGGCADGECGNTCFHYFILTTSAAGKVEWKYEVAGQANITIDIVAYIK